MSLTKKQAIKDLKRDKVSNQQSLVKKIEGTKTSKKIKKYIPGGKTLKEQLPKERFPTAINNWLKHCRHFSEMEISFLDPKPKTLEENKVYDFDTNTQNFEWEIRGRKWLSELLAETLTKDKVVSVKVKKDGIYSYTGNAKTKVAQENKDWFPFISFTSQKRG